MHVESLLVFCRSLMLGQLSMLLERGMAQFALKRSVTSVDANVILDITIFFKAIVAVGAVIHRIVPLRGLVENLFGEVDSLLAFNVGDLVGLSVQRVSGMDVIEAVSFSLVFCGSVEIQDI